MSGHPSAADLEACEYGGLQRLPVIRTLHIGWHARGVRVPCNGRVLPVDDRRELPSVAASVVDRQSGPHGVAFLFCVVVLKVMIIGIIES